MHSIFLQNLTIGNYENWEEEKWVDVSNKDWQKFMGKLSKKLLKKGVDGFFIDNCDVYDYAKTKKNFKGLAKILKNIKRLGKGVIINGGDVFVTKYRKTYGLKRARLENSQKMYANIFPIMFKNVKKIEWKSIF